MTIYRQGDVLIERLDGPEPTPGPAVEREAGRIVLALGEATGHAHAIRERGAVLYALAEDLTPAGDAAWAEAARILRVTAKKGVDLRHEEHSTIHLPAGTYRVTRQREWTGEDERRVED